MSPSGPTSLASLDGEIMPAAEATIPVTDEGLVRGDGVFEVIRVYDGTPYAFDAHVARLERSAANIRLPVDPRTRGMTKMNIKGNWNEIKGKLKQKYAELTDDDLTFAEGKEDEMLGRLQKRLGKSKEDVRREIEEF